MASLTLTTIFAPSLPPQCEPTTPWLLELSSYFHTCIPTPQAAITTALGTLSIVSWLFAQMPQIYKNYQIKSTAGLSLFFLVEWLMGDATNLLGALFTHQATWQVIIASYYVFVDVCLVIQYFWYTYLTHWVYAESLHSSSSSIDGDDASDMINSLSPINTSFRDDQVPDMEEEDNQTRLPLAQPVNAPQFSNVNYEKNSSPSAHHMAEKFGSSWMASPSPRTILLAMTLSSLTRPVASAPIPPPSDASRLHLFRASTNLEFAGMILSWSSTLLYLGSRLPQLYKNWTRQSTAGLSPLLFFAAFCGNFFYSTSMLTNPYAWNDFEPHGGHGWADEHGSLRLEWIASAAPFFLGAFGVLFLDATMGIQFLMYGEKDAKVVKVRDGHGHSHWERVNGWMRGWIPTISGKEKVVDLAESQRLLGESRGHQLSRRSTTEYGTYGTL